ncbi:MAG: hypothetical protein Q8838_02810, partial [Candidatus Phytoplasma australasiaticum]|nr:hypothetical protein [Candidatus Phytoplasma australasiaticum]
KHLVDIIKKIDYCSLEMTLVEDYLLFINSKNSEYKLKVCARARARVCVYVCVFMCMHIIDLHHNSCIYNHKVLIMLRTTAS